MPQFRAHVTLVTYEDVQLVFEAVNKAEAEIAIYRGIDDAEIEEWEPITTEVHEIESLEEVEDA